MTPTDHAASLFRRILAANDDDFARSRPFIQDQILDKFKITADTDLGFLERARLSFAGSPQMPHLWPARLRMIADHSLSARRWRDLTVGFFTACRHPP